MHYIAGFAFRCLFICQYGNFNVRTKLAGFEHYVFGPGHAAQNTRKKYSARWSFPHTHG
jgi:hypothetical protein